MMQHFITVRLIVICVLSWLLVIAFYSPPTGEAPVDELISIYGIVADSETLDGGNATLITVLDGDNVWKVIFDDPGHVPELGRAVIVTAKVTTGDLLIAICYNYP
jgi:hypothetical protein